MDRNDRSSLEPTTLPINHGQVIRVRRPFEFILFSLEFLELHRQPPFVYLSLWEDAEMARQSKFVANRNKPLGWVPLVPLGSVPVIHRKLMVEIMISLPERHKGRQKMVPRCVLIIECTLAQPMSQRIDRECRLEFPNQQISASDEVFTCHSHDALGPSERNRRKSTHRASHTKSTRVLL